MSNFRQIGTRSVFLIVLVAAAFCAGWNAHKHWPARRMEQTVLDKIQANPFAADAIKEAIVSGKKVSVDYAQDTGMTVVRIVEPVEDLIK